MDARLQVTDSGGRRIVTLDKPVFLIGRRTAADLQLVNADVSREHAEIASDGLKYLLRDRGSRYGTFVNGEQVTERPLKHGDRIRLGRTDAVELTPQVEGKWRWLGTKTLMFDTTKRFPMATKFSSIWAMRNRDCGMASTCCAWTARSTSSGWRSSRKAGKCRC